MKDIFKAMVWGATLLVLLISVALSGLFALMNYDYTISSSELAANQRVADQVLPDLAVLGDMFYKANQTEEIALRRSEPVKNAIAAIKQTVEDCKKCSDLKTPYFSDWMAYSKYADYIKALSDPKSVSSINSSAVTMTILALVAMVIGVYLITALFKYKKLTALGEVVLFSLVAPVYVLVYSASVSSQFTTEFGGAYYNNVGGAIETFIFTFLAIFVIYPPAIIIARKRGLHLIDVFKLKGC